MTRPDSNLAASPASGTSTGPLAGAPWGLVSYGVAGQRVPPRAGILDQEGRVLRLTAGDSGMRSLLGAWDTVEAELEDVDLDALEEVASAEVGIAISDPAKIVCAAANYHAHAVEMGGESPPEGVLPYFFFKPPSTTLIGDGEAIEIGAWEGAKVDWEAELAVVIGRRASNLKVEQAMNVVAGYTVLNDITDRSRLHRSPTAGPPFTFDWVSCKSRDRSCPLGSVIVPRFLVADPASLSIRLWVNDVLKQDSTTADMIDDIPTLISTASEIMTLEPGDLVATGTPDGVGRPREEYLVVGDTVSLEVEGVGRLTNRVVA